MTTNDKIMHVVRCGNLAFTSGVALGYVPMSPLVTMLMHFFFWPMLALWAAGMIVGAFEICTSLSARSAAEKP